MSKVKTYNPSKQSKEKAQKVKNEALERMGKNISPDVRSLCNEYKLDESTFYRIYRGGMGFKKSPEDEKTVKIVSKPGKPYRPGDLFVNQAKIEYRPKTLSPSSAGTFRQCPRRWKLTYVDKLPSKTSDNAMQGNFVHKVLEDLLAFEPSERTKENTKKLCSKYWGKFKEGKDYKSLEHSRNDQKKFKQEVWAFIEGYFDEFDPSRVDVMEREMKIEGSAGKVPFRGIIDLLERTEDGIRVTDYKTGKAPKGPYVKDALSQIWLYASALQSIGKEVDSVSLVYIKNGTTKPGKIIERKMNEVEMDRAVTRHEGTWDDIHSSIDNGQFEPKTGPLCGWCDHIDVCEEGTKFLGKKKLAK